MSELIVTCACGYEARGEEDAVVAETQRHGVEVHNMDVTREQVLDMSRPAGD